MPCASTAVRTLSFPTLATVGDQFGQAAKAWSRLRPTTCLFETSWFLTLGVADMVMTTALLNTGMACEINPLARFFLFSIGLHGLIGYKCVTLAVAAGCAQLITRHRPRTAKAVLHTGIWVQLVVVAYSVVLLVLVDE